MRCLKYFIVTVVLLFSANADALTWSTTLYQSSLSGVQTHLMMTPAQTSVLESTLVRKYTWFPRYGFRIYNVIIPQGGSVVKLSTNVYRVTAWTSSSIIQPNVFIDLDPAATGTDILVGTEFLQSQSHEDIDFLNRIYTFIPLSGKKISSVTGSASLSVTKIDDTHYRVSIPKPFDTLTITISYINVPTSVDITPLTDALYLRASAITGLTLASIFAFTWKA